MFKMWKQLLNSSNNSDTRNDPLWPPGGAVMIKVLAVSSKSFIISSFFCSKSLKLSSFSNDFLQILLDTFKNYVCWVKRQFDKPNNWSSHKYLKLIHLIKIKTKINSDANKLQLTSEMFLHNKSLPAFCWLNAFNVKWQQQEVIDTRLRQASIRLLFLGEVIDRRNSVSCFSLFQHQWNIFFLWTRHDEVWTVFVFLP